MRMPLEIEPQRPASEATEVKSIVSILRMQLAGRNSLHRLQSSASPTVNTVLHKPHPAPSSQSEAATSFVGFLLVNQSDRG